MRNPKILMKLRLSGACEKLNKQRKERYNYRLKQAIYNGLGFRFNKDIVRTKNLKELLKYNGYEIYTGICLVCGQRAPCSCTIEIKECSKQVRFV